ncbi:DnaJ-domain-containing protein [Dacryopinax primogenitus]|uniref:DnaJ-domain-containing protein n=1 Tax=Dacryopinax primogenitus (strain DJM 731) TaxID=1858805 RepID=M5GEQ0_DACPD|nr:DnaJ-domain-containing protein [Dacryopinax primogenitus]EJU03468.1 DnaJ-domain-containing protein [Dacryopinax primogenitus]
MPRETEYYELLGVSVDIDNAAELKKAYRKQAMIWHPDKNSSPQASEMFQKMSRAYEVLSDPQLKTIYDKEGEKGLQPTATGEGVPDPMEFFAQIFGGDAFGDYVGEISLIKDMSDMAGVIIEDEEGEPAGGTPPASGTASPAGATAGTSTPIFVTTPWGETTPAPPAPEAPSAAEPSQAPTLSHQSSIASSSMLRIDDSTGRSSKASSVSERRKEEKSAARAKKNKLTQEQREKLQEIEAKRAAAMEARIKDLTEKLKKRLEPFVEAKHPGEKGDVDTEAFEKKMRAEAEELKFESFGLELLHTIGDIYAIKATSALRARKFLGIPGFFSRMKERGSFIKEGLGVLSSAISVQATMQEMERMSEKGEIPEEHLAILEKDMTSKILLASWRGTRFEVVQVLREVCDRVLKEKGVSDQVLLNRARGLFYLGAIFKSTKADESDEERRELERLVAEAAQSKSKKRKDAKAAAAAAAHAHAHTNTHTHAKA